MKLSKLTWSWTNFSSDGNMSFNGTMYEKLREKAEKLYGPDILLSNIYIQDNVGSNVGIHLGSTLLGALVDSIINKGIDSSSDDYNYAFELCYLGTLAKIVTISADVYQMIDQPGTPIILPQTDSITLSDISEKPAVFSKITGEYDKFKNVTFYSHSSLSSKPFQVYVAKSEDNEIFRVILQYTGEDWIFFDRAILVNDEGERITWNVESWDKSTEVLSGSVFEYYYTLQPSE